MTETERARVKEIYFKYCCNSFFLHRETDAEEYESYNVSRSEELKWRDEFIETWKNGLGGEDFLRALFCLQTAHAGEALPEVLAAAQMQTDGYARLHFARAIMELVGSTRVNAALREKALGAAARICRGLIEQPFEISPLHRKIIAQSLKPFGVSTEEEEYVRRYAQNLLRRI